MSQSDAISSLLSFKSSFPQFLTLEVGKSCRVWLPHDEVYRAAVHFLGGMPTRRFVCLNALEPGEESCPACLVGVPLKEQWITHTVIYRNNRQGVPKITKAKKIGLDCFAAKLWRFGPSVARQLKGFLEAFRLPDRDLVVTRAGEFTYVLEACAERDSFCLRPDVRASLAAVLQDGRRPSFKNELGMTDADELKLCLIRAGRATWNDFGQGGPR